LPKQTLTSRANHQFQTTQLYKPQLHIQTATYIVQPKHSTNNYI